MSEKITNPKGHEFKSTKIEQGTHTPEQEASKNEVASDIEQDKPSIEQLTRSVETHARSREEYRQSLEKPKDDHHPVFASKQLKDLAYTRTLVRVRKQLSPVSRLLSKAIHSPVIDRPSEIVGNSVARPSAMLGGGIAALVGTTGVSWIVNHYGYEYNYLAIIVLFLAGATVGVIIEALVKAVKS